MTKKQFRESVLDSIEAHPEEWNVNPFNDTILAHCSGEIQIYTGPFLLFLSKIVCPISANFSFSEWWRLRRISRHVIAQSDTAKMAKMKKAARILWRSAIK